MGWAFMILSYFLLVLKVTPDAISMYKCWSDNLSMLQALKSIGADKLKKRVGFNSKSFANGFNKFVRCEVEPEYLPISKPPLSGISKAQLTG